MEAFRLLIVEDNEGDLLTCRDTVERYTDEKKRNIELVECKNIDEAIAKLDNSFDGAIIDLKLGSSDGEGNIVIDHIVKSFYRIPVAVFTGTPDSAIEMNHIGVFKKGETEYEHILDKFWDIHNTGLTRILGGRGKIEETLSKVFQDNLLPQKHIWVKYGENDPEKTEKALLRHTLNHLLQLLDNDEEKFFPEEVYISPPLTKTLQTGSIVVRKCDNKSFVILNPACDLVIRKGNGFKTERILIVEIDDDKIIDKNKEMIEAKNKKAIIPIITCQYHNDNSEAYKELLKCQTENIKQSISGLFMNSKGLNYHWLPKTDVFDGGFINFRKLTTLTLKDFKKEFNCPKTQISPAFVKDIVARFSSYYARQGQPDINYGTYINAISSN